MIRKAVGIIINNAVAITAKILTSIIVNDLSIFYLIISPNSIHYIVYSNQG
jgi:hypothetical protein